MLYAYRQQTQRLLNDVDLATYNTGDLDIYINQARGQVAGEGECIRLYSTLAVDDTAQQYPFSAIVFPIGTTGVAGVINVRMVTYAIAMGALRVNPREWEWFNNYVLSNARPIAGPPRFWAQYGQGNDGNLFVNVLDIAYTLNIDAVCFPSDLTTDATPEAVPQFWRDAVPYYSAYLAALSMPGAEQRAERMLQLYEIFARRARQFATPSVFPHQYAQSTDVTLAAKLGLRPQTAPVVQAAPQSGTV